MKKKTKGVLALLIAVIMWWGIFIACDNGSGTTDPCKDGHDWGAYTQTTPPTCTAAGIKTRACTRDGCTAVDPVTETGDAALDHSAPNGTPATCATDGNTGTGTCAREGCGETVTGTVIPALGHANPADWTSGTAATCTTASTRIKTCTREGCSVTLETETQAALGHDHNESLVCLNPNCDHQYALGDTGPGGGIIYFVADGQGGRPLGFNFFTGTTVEDTDSIVTAHYLEAAPASGNFTSLSWGAIGIDVPGITNFTDFTHVEASRIGNGKRNTAMILLADPDAPAAKACNEYVNNGITDWFLPSFGELYLYYQSSVTGKPTETSWTSSQFVSSHSWAVNFNDGDRFGGDKTFIDSVRAVRAF